MNENSEPTGAAFGDPLGGGYHDDVESVDGDFDQPASDDEARAAMDGPHRNDHEGSEISDEDGSSDDDSEQKTRQNRGTQGASGSCSTICQAKLRGKQSEITQLNNRLTELGEEKDTLEEELERVNRELSQLRLRQQQRTQRRTQRTWPQLLRAGVHENAEIYKISCLEENMSPKLDNIHPNLRLRKMTSRERVRAIFPDDDLPQPQRQETASDLDVDAIVEELVRSLINQILSDDEETLFVDDDTDIPKSEPKRLQLPKEVWARVFQHVFDYGGRLIHCISRLDPLEDHDEPISDRHDCSGLPKRFHISNAACSITAAIRPNKLLGLFQVCKLWYFLGAHTFYGQNTFAFSSLGEFGRFCGGIGAARRQRIQSVELLWIGSQYLVFDCDAKGKYTSKRTWYIHWLLSMPRLRNLVVHIPESAPMYSRRGHEPKHIHDYMAKLTIAQPNYRRYRALRTVQGIDFIYQLRDMKTMLFYDFSKHLKEGGGRHFIRDWTFFEDVWKNVSMPERGRRKENAKLENLKDIVHGYSGQQDLMDLVREIFEDENRSPFDDGRDVERNVIPVMQIYDSDEDDADEGRGISTRSGSESDSESTDDSLGSSDDDSDDDESDDQGIQQKKPNVGQLASGLASLRLGRPSLAKPKSQKTAEIVEISDSEQSEVDTNEDTNESDDENESNEGSASDEEENDAVWLSPHGTPIIDLTRLGEDDEDAKPIIPASRLSSPTAEYLRNRGHDETTAIEIDDEDDDDVAPHMHERASASVPRGRNPRSTSSELFVDDVYTDFTASQPSRASAPVNDPTPELQVEAVDTEQAELIAQARARQHRPVPTFANKRKSPDEDDFDDRARKRTGLL